MDHIKIFTLFANKTTNLFAEKQNTTIPITDPERLLGSKIPITELILEAKNNTGEVVYRKSTILIGTLKTIPSTRIEAIKKDMREEYLEFKRKEQSCPKDNLTNMDMFPDPNMKM